MKTLLPILLLIAFLIASPSISYSQPGSENQSFSFVTHMKKQFYPGENIFLNVWLKNDEYVKGDESTLTFNVKIFRIIELDSFYLAQNRQYRIDALGRDSINLLKYCTEVKSYEESLDFVHYGYRSESLEKIQFGVLPKGAYLIRVMGGHSISYSGFVVSSLDLVTKSGNNTFLAFIAESHSGNPIANAKVKCYFNDELAASGVTEDGVYFVANTDSVTIKKAKREFLVIVESHQDFIISDHAKFFGMYSSAASGYVYTNQPVYRTNSMVYFKGILTQYGYKKITSFSDKEVEVVISGPRQNEILRDTLVTNSNGSFDGSVYIKDEYPIGFYTIQTYFDGKVIGSGNFTVNQYKKPEYNVSLEAEKTRYNGDEVLKATVSADYYFGNPVTDGEVTYSIYKSTFYKPWWSFSSYSWWYDINSVRGINRWYDDEMLYEGKGQLNDEGKFEIEYELNEDFQHTYKSYFGASETYESDYEYRIFATVSDKSRREIYGSINAFVTRGEYYLSSRTSKYFYRPGDKAFIDVGSYDFDNKPVSRKFEINIYRIKYKNWKEQDRKLVKFLTGTTDTTGKGIVYFNIDEKFKSGYYAAEITSKDSRGEKISTSNSFTVYTDKPVWYGHYYDPKDINIVTDKDEYFKGDTCRAFISLPDSNRNVLITADAGDILYSSVEHFTGPVKYVEFILDDNYKSNFTITAGYFYEQNYHSGSAEVMFIPKEQFLNIELEPSNDMYRPGDSGNVRIKVTDYYGSPVSNAEVSLGIIDESIYYIREDNTPDIRKAFYHTLGSVGFNYESGYIQSNNNSRRETIFDRYEYINGKYDNNLITVKGILLDEDDKPVSKMEIYLNNDFLAGETDALGYFAFQIPAGMYIVSLKGKDFDVKNVTSFTAGNNRLLHLVVYKTPEINMENERIQRMKEQYDLQSEGTGFIRGSVKDQVDNIPLSGAIVVLEGMNIGAETNENGEFEIAGLPPGEYTLTASYIGYADVKITGIKIDSDRFIRLDIKLNSDVDVTLEAIEINAERMEIDLDQSGRIVTQDQLENNGLRGIENIVSVTTGVVTDERGQHINIRGTRSDENVIIVDGVSTAFVPDDLMTFITPSVRKDFRDAIHWAPYVTTDENGFADVLIKYPDNLTTWRFTSRVITNDRKVGEQRANVITRKDLLIRAEAPRFFRETDEVVITTIVHNYLETTKRVKVSVVGENLFVKDNKEKFIDVKPNSDVSIDWNVRVLNSFGSAKLYTEALTDEESDAMEVLLPLEPKGLQEVKTNRVSISEVYATKEKTVHIPYDSELNTAGMMVSISPSLASDLFTSLEYLVGYPYGCTEQTISRFIPLVIMAGVYDSLGLSFNDNIREKIPDMVETGMSRLYNLQKDGGGWGWWSNDELDIMMSSYVITGLAIAKDLGYPVDKNMMRAGTQKLYLSLEHLEDNYDRANILYSLSLALKKDVDSIGFYIDELARKDLSVYELALSALSYKNLGEEAKALELLKRIEIKREIVDDMVYWNDRSLNNFDLRTDEVLTTAFVLKAYLNIDVDSPIIDKIVDWLIFIKDGPYWRNTRVTAGVVNALADYLLISNERDANYDVKITVNGNEVINKKISNDDLLTPSNVIYITGSDLKNGDNNIVIEKSGEGKLYFGSVTRFYNSNYSVKSDSNGFAVTREYFKLVQTEDDEGNLVYEKKKLTNEPVTSGDIILVKTKVNYVPSNLRYFMIEDPIPAGCEVVQDEDESRYEIIDEFNYSRRSYYRWRWWYSDREIRDNKVVFFANNFYRGNEFSYILRAQIPGEFYVNPAVASLMYYPQFNGNSGNFVMKIKDKKRNLD